MVYYIGSDKPLPLVEAQDWKKVDTKKEGWELEVVPFSVEKIDENTAKVNENFTGSHVYYVGSFEGCGCGFGACITYGDDSIDPEQNRIDATRRSRQLLYDYLLENKIDSLYCCWSGDEHLAFLKRCELQIESILDLNFECDEGSFYHIKQIEANQSEVSALLRASRFTP